MKVVEGVSQFKENVYPHMEGEFQALAGGQAPETLFITCSDSRIDPALITQSNPREIFVIRNAGNLVPKPGTGELAVEATIQYAVQVLQVKHVVVCGHSHCGAVKGLLDLESLNTLPAVKDWVSKSKSILEGGTPSVDEAIQKNVMLQLDNLMEYPYVAEAVQSNSLQLHGWVYVFESGKVEFLTDSANKETT